MRWPWQRRRREEPPASHLAEATAARERADEQLRRVQEQWPEVHEVARKLRLHQQHNHFGEMIRDALARGQ